MPAIKDLSRIAEKWKRVASAASGEYREGVENPSADWATETAKAEKTYEEGVQNAINRKAFGKGVRKAGSEKWQRNAVEKGPERYRQGINLAQDAYQSGFEPFRQVIASTNLPARGPKGDPRNIERVAVMAKALHDKKLSLEG